MTITKDIGKWFISVDPDDGARIRVLKYAGHDLLTSAPSAFRKPAKFFGEFENRPVYGYDDCFPTVDACIYPGTSLKCRDHGELCWEKWKMESKSDKLTFATICHNPEAKFTRILDFNGNRLTWKFEVLNLSHEKMVFLHVMHALLTLREINSLKLPLSRLVIDEVHQKEVKYINDQEITEDLLHLGKGDSKMLLLRQLEGNVVKAGFRNGLTLNITFDSKLFPTLGIWWNNEGYPEEEGLKRIEGAFEPIPGTWSDLSKSYNDGIYLEAEPGESLKWEISWEIEEKIDKNRKHAINTRQE